LEQIDERRFLMKIKELMSQDVVAVTPEISLKEVARVLADRHISGVPVVSERGKVVGVVSEADILLKERGEEARHGLLEWLLQAGIDREKIAARTAGEAMTSPAITIDPHSDVSEAARRMTEQGIKRLPVTDWAGTLVGIVTRADLVKAFARSDSEIEHEIRSDLVAGLLWMDESALDVRVERGEVTLAGETAQRIDVELLPRLVARIPGVLSVRSNLSWREDDRDRAQPRSYSSIVSEPR
jgi:CBS domain-containing protein